MNSGTTELDMMIEKIRQDTEVRAASLVSEAESFSRQRLSAFEKQCELMEKDAEKKAAEECEKIRLRFESALSMEKKRQYLKLREGLLKEAEKELFRHMENSIGSTEYEKVLIDWIAEGVIAVDRESCLVNASVKEREILTGGLMEKARARVKELTGRDVKIELSGEGPLVVQGVVVSTEDGRISYNNQVQVRYRRKETVIRALLLEELIDPILDRRKESHE